MADMEAITIHTCMVVGYIRRINHIITVLAAAWADMVATILLTATATTVVVIDLQDYFATCTIDCAMEALTTIRKWAIWAVALALVDGLMNGTLVLPKMFGGEMQSMDDE
ncbi:unnamed protein product [Absidia cylindrospora]